MSKPSANRAALFIIGAGVLGAVTVVMVPGLFEGFRTGRLVAVLVLMAGVITLAGVAKRNREKVTD